MCLDVSVCVCVRACVRACVRVCVCVCMYACLSVCLYVCLYLCMFVCSLICAVSHARGPLGMVRSMFHVDYVTKNNSSSSLRTIDSNHMRVFYDCSELRDLRQKLLPRPGTSRSNKLCVTPASSASTVYRKRKVARCFVANTTAPESTIVAELTPKPIVEAADY